MRAFNAVFFLSNLYDFSPPWSTYRARGFNFLRLLCGGRLDDPHDFFFNKTKLILVVALAATRRTSSNRNKYSLCVRDILLMNFISHISIRRVSLNMLVFYLFKKRNHHFSNASFFWRYLCKPIYVDISTYLLACFGDAPNTHFKLCIFVRPSVSSNFQLLFFLTFFNTSNLLRHLCSTLRTPLSAFVIPHLHPSLLTQ